MQTICASAVLFTDLAHKRLLEATKGEKGFYAEGKSTQFVDDVVMTLNNLEQVFQTVSRLPYKVRTYLPLITLESKSGEAQ